jgi:hypothetical protein
MTGAGSEAAPLGCRNAATANAKRPSNSTRQKDRQASQIRENQGSEESVTPAA